MDAFFVSVELLDRPELRGKPVVVGGRPDQRGVVSAASYEARKYGIHSAMPLRTASRLCPHAIFLDGHHEKYGEWSDRVATILAKFSPIVEMVSMKPTSIFPARSGCTARRWRQPTSCFGRSRKRLLFRVPVASPQPAWLPKLLPTKPSRGALCGYLRAANNVFLPHCR
jgi:DNA polymerase-4